MSNSAWCDLKTKGDILILHDICPNAKCKRPKQITCTLINTSLKEPYLEMNYRKTKKNINCLEEISKARS